MTKTATAEIAVIGIDIGKNSFHVVGLNRKGAIVLRQKWPRDQIESRLANLTPCLVGMEACNGAHHLAGKFVAAKTAEQLDLQALHRVRERLSASALVNPERNIEQTKAFIIRVAKAADGKGGYDASKHLIHKVIISGALV